MACPRRETPAPVRCRCRRLSSFHHKRVHAEAQSHGEKQTRNKHPKPVMAGPVSRPSTNTLRRPGLWVAGTSPAMTILRECAPLRLCGSAALRETFLEPQGAEGDLFQGPQLVHELFEVERIGLEA